MLLLGMYFKVIIRTYKDLATKLCVLTLLIRPKIKKNLISNTRELNGKTTVCAYKGMPLQPFKRWHTDFPGGAVIKNPPANAGDMGLNPGPGRSHMPRSN